MTKRVLAYHDLPTPAFQVFERLDEQVDISAMQFPVLRQAEPRGHRAWA